MKRVVTSLFGTIIALVMLLDFKTHPASVAGAPAATSPTGGTTSSGASDSGSTPTPSATGSAAGTTSGSGRSSSPTKSSGTKTYTGASADTRWGPVQVRITVTGGKVAKAEAVVYPLNNSRDQEINSYAIPTLNQEAVAAASAKLDMVSGATYTSNGYIQSLQSALDQAGL